MGLGIGSSAQLASVQPTRTPGGLQTLAATLIRPADTTAYVQYDLVANAVAGAVAIEIPNAVRSAGECFRWEGARLRTTNAAVKGKTLRIHLWRAAPTLTVNDNGAFNPTGAQTFAVADIAGYVGYIDIQFTEAGVIGAAGRGTLVGARTVSPVTGTSLWATLEVRDAAYPPLSAEQISLVLEGQWP